MQKACQYGRLFAFSLDLVDIPDLSCPKAFIVNLLGTSHLASGKSRQLPSVFLQMMTYTQITITYDKCGGVCSIFDDYREEDAEVSDVRQRCGTHPVWR